MYAMSSFLRNGLIYPQRMNRQPRAPFLSYLSIPFDFFRCILNGTTADFPPLGISEPLRVARLKRRKRRGRNQTLPA